MKTEQFKKFHLLIIDELSLLIGAQEYEEETGKSLLNKNRVELKGCYEQLVENIQRLTLEREEKLEMYFDLFVDVNGELLKKVSQLLYTDKYKEEKEIYSLISEMIEI